MGKALAERLEINVHHVLVTEADRSPRHARIQIDYIRWDTIARWVEEHQRETLLTSYNRAGGA
jgi:hypothetical protein